MGMSLITPKNLGDHAYVHLSSLTGSSKGYLANLSFISAVLSYFVHNSVHFPVRVLSLRNLQAEEMTP